MPKRAPASAKTEEDCYIWASGVVVVGSPHARWEHGNSSGQGSQGTPASMRGNAEGGLRRIRARPWLPWGAPVVDAGLGIAPVAEGFVTRRVSHRRRCSGHAPSMKPAPSLGWEQQHMRVIPRRAWVPRGYEISGVRANGWGRTSSGIASWCAFESAERQNYEARVDEHHRAPMNLL